ncbi:hypothetical protein [Streptomyces clavifer]|uniref:hypothetical protein n=1 Tax=Streptomyces clavifer TaxID=68188 RepID=UPI0037F87EEA
MIKTKGRMHFMAFTESFDAKVMWHLLVGHLGHKVHLIVQRHPGRCSKGRRGLARRPKRRDRAAFLAVIITRAAPG